MENKGKRIIRISGWVVKFWLKEISVKEQKELDVWLNESEHNRKLFEELCAGLADRGYFPGLTEQETEKAFQRFVAKKKILDTNLRGHFYFKSILKYAAILVLPLLLCAVLWWLSGDVPERQVELISMTRPFSERKPILTLADGQEIIVNHTDLNRLSGVLLTGPDSSELIYTDLAVVAGPGEYHTLTTPAQCDYHFTLSDGTKVWVNAKSAIKYPVTFGKDEREVYVRGEVYLEVAKDSTRPFYVVTDAMRVEVLGTSFNVNAYENEDFVVITLAGGKVAAYTKESSYELLPGKQLVFNRYSQHADLRQVNVHDFISWKEGLYIFKGQTLAEVAKVVERWYEVGVVFENIQASREIYTGIIYKEEPLTFFVNRLNTSSNFKCMVENNVVYIR